MFVLPNLPYDKKALEPYIDAETMELHHGKHHASYVDNLNKALDGQEEFLKMSVEELLQKIHTLNISNNQTVINNAGGHANHSFFWKTMCPSQDSGEPVGEIKDALNSEFGGLEKFKEKFTEKALSVFGSGWAFLVVDKNHKLIIKRHSFQNSPLMDGATPILGIDVWEHAYYLKYKNVRVDYIKAWWNVINWKAVGENIRRAGENT
jgi:superoxide dismutase, Fe-Mn family